MILELLLNIQIKCKISIKILKNIILGEKSKILVAFDDTIAVMINYKKLNPVVTELFIRGRKLNISIFFYYRIIL